MIGDKDLSVPEKMLDVCALRHKLLANNIANAQVPGYRKLDVDFAGQLQKAIRSGDPQEVRNAEVRVTRSPEAGVQAESEVARLGKNELMFNAFADIASFRLRLLRSAMQSR